MPFLGKTPAQGFVNSVTKDDFTPNGTTTAFTLSKAPATVNEIEVYVGNVRQEPTDAYSVSGTTLTMTEAPATNTNFYVMHIGGTTQSSTTLPGGSTVPGDFDVSGKLGIGTSTHHDSSTKLTAAGRINTSNGTATGSINYGGGSVVNMGSLTNHPVQLMVNNSTKWKIDTNGNLISAGGGGIVLGNTSYAASNELDDYEEGDFVPTITTSGGTTTYVSQKGAYTRIGRVCHIMVNLVASNNSNVNLYNMNLPFTAGHVSSGTAWYPTIAIGNFYNVNLTGGGTMLGAYTVNGQAAMRLHSCGNNTNQLAPSCTANTNFELRFEGSFITQ